MPLQHEFNIHGSIAQPSIRKDFIINENHTIGKGSTSTVKLALQCDSKERAVVKMVNLSLHSRFFDQELQSLSTLNHQNIVKLYNYDENNGYLFLEYIPYPCLYDYIQNYGPLSEESAFRVFYQIVDAFLHMHSLGISHQDFKPENVCYNPVTEDIKIIDFGLSLSDEEITMNWIGSPIYMAPEVHAKKPYSRYKADIWSLGVSFYEIVTGDTPFSDCLDLDDLINRLNSYDNDPIPIPDNVSSGTSFLLKRMLSLDPRERISLPMVMDLIVQRLKTS